MIDVRRPATLRGFPVSVGDIGDQLHLCHPLLSFEGDPALYLAHRLDWQDNPEALAIVDPDEASTLGTLLPPTLRWPIASGEGVIAAGASLVQAAKVAEVEFPSVEIPFSASSSGCWVGLATSALFADLRSRLTEEARGVFDEALGDAAFHRSPLSKRGNAALLLMRKSGPRRRDDLAIRQLAGARQNGEFDLYRRLLIRFALELDVQERVLDERVGQHIANAADWRALIRHRWLPPRLVLEFDAREEAQGWSTRQMPVEVKTAPKVVSYMSLEENTLVLVHPRTLAKHFFQSDERVQYNKLVDYSYPVGVLQKLSKPYTEAV